MVTCEVLLRKYIIWNTMNGILRWDPVREWKEKIDEMNNRDCMEQLEGKSSPRW